MCENKKKIITLLFIYLFIYYNTSLCTQNAMCSSKNTSQNMYIKNMCKLYKTKIELCLLKCAWECKNNVTNLVKCIWGIIIVHIASCNIFE